MEFTKILARKYELKEDTGGAGQFRGGLGIERELEMMQDDVAYTGLGDRHKFHPWGLDGGKRRCCRCILPCNSGWNLSQKWDTRQPVFR